MVITAFLSMWLSNTATAAMMLSLIMPMLDRLPAGDPARKGLLLAVPLAANVGGLGTPIGSPPNAIAMQYMRQLDLAPGFLQWMIIGVPGVIGMLAIAWLVLRVLFKTRGTLAPVAGTSGERGMTGGAMVVLAGTLVTVAGWMTGRMHGMATGTVALIPVILFFGTGLLRVTDLRSLSWDVLLLMGGGLSLGQAMSSSGLAAWVIELLPVEGLSVYWLMVVFGSVACLMSCLMSNTATANLIMPILLGLSVTPLSPVLLGVAFSCSLAMALPISTPPNAMAFGAGELRVADMVKPGLILTLAGLGMVFTVGYWWWGRVGLW